jgi:uncharacterized membrane protein
MMIGSAHFCLRCSTWSLIALLLAGAAVAVPWLFAHHSFALGLALDRGFALICHQRPERSFWIFGGAVAVCSRCLGIYLGAAAGLLFRTSRTLAFRLLIAAAALNLLDALTELAGLHGNWLAVRFVFGLTLGTAAALLISSTMAATQDSASLAARHVGNPARYPLTVDRHPAVRRLGTAPFPENRASEDAELLRCPRTHARRYFISSTLMTRHFPILGAILCAFRHIVNVK